MKNTHPLPDKLSELILVALEDLEKAERSKKYHVCMLDWHEPYDCDGERKCSVCFAGSVIAFGLQGNFDTYLTPDDFPEHAEKLDALNNIRAGFLPDRTQFDVTCYYNDPERWKTEMVLTARALEEIDL